MEKNFLGKWEAVRLVHPHMGYDFEPGEWGIEFLADGKITIYMEGEPVGTYNCTFRDGMLTIEGEVPQRAEISDSELTVHDTDPDGTACRTLYARRDFVTNDRMGGDLFADPERP